VADIDWRRFRDDVAMALAAAGEPARAIAQRSNGLITEATFTRLKLGPLGPGNYVAVCQALTLKPDAYLVPGNPRLTMKKLVKQHLTSAATRETRGEE